MLNCEQPQVRTELGVLFCDDPDQKSLQAVSSLHIMSCIICVYRLADLGFYSP